MFFETFMHHVSSNLVHLSLSTSRSLGQGMIDLDLQLRTVRASVSFKAR